MRTRRVDGTLVHVGLERVRPDQVARESDRAESESDEQRVDTSHALLYPAGAAGLHRAGKRRYNIRWPALSLRFSRGAGLNCNSDEGIEMYMQRGFFPNPLQPLSMFAPFWGIELPEPTEVPKPVPLNGYSGVIDLLETVVRANPGAVIYRGQDDLADLQDHIFSEAARLKSAHFFQLLAKGGTPGGPWNNKEVGNDPFRHPSVRDHIMCSTAFAGPAMRNPTHYFHMHLNEVPHLLSTRLRPKVAIVMISPTDSDGYVTLGPDAGLSDAAVRQAEIRIGIRNSKAPRFARRIVTSAREDIATGCAFKEADFHFIVDIHRGFGTDADAPLSDIAVRPAKAVASLIENGSVVQAGIGSGELSPDNILRPELYASHEGIRIFAELVGKYALRLAMMQNAGDVWAGFFAGPQSHMDLLDRDAPYGRRINVLPTEKIVDTGFITKHCGGKLTSLAGALAVDAQGAVASAGLGTRIFSGVGGAFRYADAAIHTGGQCIVVMPSTATVDGRLVSRVMSVLPLGTPITLSVRMVSRIVTEFGITDDLHLMMNHERAACMVGIAHPDFREQLMYYIKRDYDIDVDLHRAVDSVDFGRLGV